jgi:hypothetical protein
LDLLPVVFAAAEALARLLQVLLLLCGIHGFLAFGPLFWRLLRVCVDDLLLAFAGLRRPVGCQYRLSHGRPHAVCVHLLALIPIHGLHSVGSLLLMQPRDCRGRGILMLNIQCLTIRRCERGGVLRETIVLLRIARLSDKVHFLLNLTYIQSRRGLGIVLAWLQV